MLAGSFTGLRDTCALLAVLGAAVALGGCGAPAKSLSAADDALRTQDDLVRATDEFIPPWTPREDAPPPGVVATGTVSPIVERAPGRLRTLINELRRDEALELIKTGVCALLKYHLEYSESPSTGEIEAYLGAVSEEQGFVWLTPEDRSILAGELNNVASNVANLGLTAEDYAEVIEIICELAG